MTPPQPLLEILGALRESGGRVSLIRVLVLAVVVAMLCRERNSFSDAAIVVGSLLALAYHRGKEKL